VGRGEGTRNPLICKIIPKNSQIAEKGDGRITPLRTLKIGTLNVRGCGTIESKRMEIGDMFERRKMDVLALRLSETKMKGKGEIMFGNVKGRMSGVVGGRGVPLLVSEQLTKCVVDWKEVSSRIMWVKIKFRCKGCKCILWTR
jgi:hypothetical protein